MFTLMDEATVFLHALYSAFYTFYEKTQTNCLDQNLILTVDVTQCYKITCFKPFSLVDESICCSGMYSRTAMYGRVWTC